MALPSKGTGLRKIVVDDVTYLWRINKKPYSYDGGLWVIICPESQQDKQLIVYPTLGYSYSKRTANDDGTHTYTTEEVSTPVTPRVIRGFILAALKNGWAEAPKGIFPIINYYLDIPYERRFTYNFGILNARVSDPTFLRVHDTHLRHWTYVSPHRPDYYIHTYFDDLPLQNWRYEIFIVKMMIHFSRFRFIPEADLVSFLADCHFIQYEPSNEEEYAYLLQFIDSSDADPFLRKLRVIHTLTILDQKGIYAMVALTDQGLLGLIFDQQ